MPTYKKTRINSRNGFMTVTGQNIDLVAFRLNKFIQKHAAVKMQCAYPDSILANKLGLTYSLEGKGWKGIRHIEQSNVSIMPSSNFKLEVVRNATTRLVGDDFIRFNFKQVNGVIGGFLVNCGDKIKITPAHVFHWEKHPHLENVKVLNTWRA